MATNDDMASTNPDDAAAAADAGNMDQLRSLLFGSQMRDYDRRFQQLDARLSNELEHLREDTRKRTETLDAFVRSEFERLSTEFRSELLAEREARIGAQQEAAAALEELRHALLARLDDLDGALTEESANREVALRGLADALREELETRAAGVERALTAEREQLRGDKAGRDELAQLFSEFSARLARTRDQAD